MRNRPNDSKTEIRRSPATSLGSDLIAMNAASRSDTAFVVRSRKEWPLSVSTRCRVLRLNSFVARSFSSLSICRDTEDGDMPSTVPVFEKLPHSAAFIKIRMASNTVDRLIRYAESAKQFCTKSVFSLRTKLFTILMRIYTFNGRFSNEELLFFNTIR